MNMIHVGEGRGAWRSWGLMDHEGPRLRLKALGSSIDRRVFLPNDLLVLLYRRFAEANPSGTSLVSDEEYLSIALQSHSSEEIERLAEERKALQNIDLWEPSSPNYPLLRPYLPEIFEPQTLEVLADDPFLDSELLGIAEILGEEGGGIRPDLWVDRAARWSPEWRDFCDRFLNGGDVDLRQRVQFMRRSLST